MRALSEAYANIGESYYDEEKLPEAEEHYQSALRLLNKHGGPDTKVLLYQKCYSDVYMLLGQVVKKSNRPAAALAIYQKARAVQSKIIQRRQQWLRAQPRYNQAYAFSAHILGNLYRATGDIHKAGLAYKEAHKVNLALLATAPNNAMYMYLTGVVENDLGNWYLMTVNYKAAEQVFSKAMLRWQTLVKRPAELC